MSDHFIGQITVFPYSFPPQGWADCAGQLLSISQNTALFSLLGTQFGGDGRSTFGLPNLQGVVPVGQGSQPGGSTYTIGDAGGAEAVALTSNTIPSHNHSMPASTVHGTVDPPAGQVLSTVQKGLPTSPTRGEIYNTAAPDTTLTPGSIGLSGGNQGHNNVQPFLVLRYCIALQGVYPPRS